MTQTVTLDRPVGTKELAFIEASEWANRVGNTEVIAEISGEMAGAV